MPRDRAARPAGDAGAERGAGTAGRAEAGGVRRQARGLARMAAILDAAEEVISEVGYAEATTNAIAARAGVSPGTLYQFFRNKDQVVEELAVRYGERLREFWAARTTPESAGRPLPELVDGLLDAVLAFKVSQPAFWPLFYGSALPDQLAAVAAGLQQGTVERIAGFFGDRCPELTRERRELLATMTVGTVRTMMPMLLGADEARRRELLTEIKAMLVRYLGPAIGVEGRAAVGDPAGERATATD
ncbi:TetR/AcrR family transcriptional regulator [Actinoalloteichus sp. AHMU CJ021]|uniref:Transcriptional regulator, TetR family n=1 Tax=Actinoalloteichus caeruleus DSM 43889 TaxID=1120930 RepID=A0ABT1JGL3_ACTCY|nr:MULTISPECIES: TetR/AcrR family transcriptional regulator [Actinoalloteichus]AUS77720.1 TetR/AcrR family transcriptional regulator [Actinoalloteichus sp. AHMU CJ021]MCP2331644.1 transcriptional regulator, TetR family [Actinoalloteichus caeruleus DSM 43889]